MNTTLQPIFAKQRALSRFAAVSRWLVAGLLAAALPFSVLLWLDNALVLTTTWRWLAFVLWVGGLLWMFGRVARALRAPEDRELAALLDEHSGLRGGYVISTAAELDTPGTTGTVEAALLTRLHAVANSLAGSASPPHPLPRRWQLAVLVLALVLIGAANHLSWRRLTQPWKDLPFTTLTLAGPEKRPIAREPFTVHGEVRGRTPRTIALEINGGAAIVVPVAGDGTYHYTFGKGVPAPITLVARGDADGVSAPLAIAFRELLRATGYAHQVRPPAYAKRPTRLETRADFAVLAHSNVSYSVTLNQKKPCARMVFDTDRPPLELLPDTDLPLVWTADLPDLTRIFGYRLEVSEPGGEWVPVGEKSQVVVRLDQPPVVEIRSHNEGDLKSPHDTFAMTFHASDDLGLIELRVSYQRLGDDKPVRQYFSIPDADTLDFTGDFKLPLDTLQFLPGDIIAVTVRVRDNDIYPAAQTASAEPILIEIPAEPAANQANGGGGGGGQQINPLLIERQLYRDTLKLASGRKSPTQAELSRRQTDNLHYIEKMIAAREKAKGPLPDLGDLLANGGSTSDDYLAFLKAAAAAASRASVRLQEIDFNAYPFILDKEGAAVAALTKAARVAPKIQPGKKPLVGVSISLLTPPPTQAESSAETKQEAINQALANLQQLQQEQAKINQALGGKTPGNPAQQGQSEQDRPASGDLPGGSSAQTLAAREQRASESAEQIRQQILALGQADNAADPRLAAEQMERANRQQSQAKTDLLQGIGGALAAGETASAALEKARQFTASLRGETPSIPTTEAQTRSPGYQQLIQEYSRRLSHD